MAGSVWRVRDEVWEGIRELLLEREPQRTGRPRVDDRLAFNAVMYVLVTGIAWRYLPAEMGCSPATAHRRLQDWQRYGVWQRLHQDLRQRLNATGRIDSQSAVALERVMDFGRPE